jgi:hypothetical protein
MANPTSNFGWQMPTPVDLVTDLPADFEVFGQAVDSSLADLKGGSTGQVLSKNSNTDMDFVWVTSDDANAIQNTIVDAKGDLIAASANDTPARLAVGANGETLVADSSTSTGLRYQGSTAAGRNTLINGGMDIWQRGTSGFTGGYAADRWFMTGSGGTLAASRSTDVPTNPYFNYSFSMVGTSATNAQIYQRIESANSTSLAGRTVTLSVWAKNSGGTTALSYVALYPTAVDNWASATVDSTADLTATSWSSSWTRYSVTITVSASAVNGYGIIFFRNGTETSTTLLTGVQLELGSVATNFSRAGATIQGELAACQRYYWRNTSDAQYGLLCAAGFVTSSTNAQLNLQNPVTMRTSATSIDFLNVLVQDANSVNYVPSSGGIDSATNTKFGTGFNFAVTGATTGRFARLLANNTTDAYIGVSAEL